MLLVAALLYVLSVGPLIWLYTHDAVPGWADAPLNWFYSPLDWVAHKFPGAFFWYAELWGWKL